MARRLLAALVFAVSLLAEASELGTQDDFEVPELHASEQNASESDAPPTADIYSTQGDYCLVFDSRVSSVMSMCLRESTCFSTVRRWEGVVRWVHHGCSRPPRPCVDQTRNRRIHFCCSTSLCNWIHVEVGEPLDSLPTASPPFVTPTTPTSEPLTERPTGNSTTELNPNSNSSVTPPIFIPPNLILKGSTENSTSETLSSSSSPSPSPHPSLSTAVHTPSTIPQSSTASTIPHSSTPTSAHHTSTPHTPTSTPPPSSPPPFSSPPSTPHPDDPTPNSLGEEDDLKYYIASGVVVGVFLVAILSILCVLVVMYWRDQTFKRHINQVKSREKPPLGVGIGGEGEGDADESTSGSVSIHIQPLDETELPLSLQLSSTPSQSSHIATPSQPRATECTV